MIRCENCGTPPKRSCAGLCWACYMKRRREPNYVPDLTDAEPARRHVKALAADGASLASIARAAGISNPTIYNLINGSPLRGGDPILRIKKTTAEALLSVMVEQQ